MSANPRWRPHVHQPRIQIYFHLAEALFNVPEPSQISVNLHCIFIFTEACQGVKAGVRQTHLVECVVRRVLALGGPIPFQKLSDAIFEGSIHCTVALLQELFAFLKAFAKHFEVISLPFGRSGDDDFIVKLEGQGRFERFDFECLRTVVRDKNLVPVFLIQGLLTHRGRKTINGLGNNVVKLLVVHLLEV